MAETKLDNRQLGGAASTGQLLRYNGTNYVPVTALVSHVIRAGISQGKPTANIEFARYKVPLPVILDSAYTDGTFAVTGSCRVNPTAAASFLVKKNGVTFLTLTVNTNGTITDSWTGGPYNLDIGDVLTFHTPATQDATLMDVSFSILGKTALLING